MLQYKYKMKERKKKMNKIYNNLSIDNLTKTEWFNQFNEYQQEQIRLGLEDNLDISWYAKKEFSEWKMLQIREGLKLGLDVSLYAKPELNINQMREIKYGLIEGLEASKYADSKLTYKEMAKIRKELQNEKQRNKCR